LSSPSSAAELCNWVEKYAKRILTNKSRGDFVSTNQENVTWFASVFPPLARVASFHSSSDWFIALFASL